MKYKMNYKFYYIKPIKIKVIINIKNNFLLIIKINNNIKNIIVCCSMFIKKTIINNNITKYK